MAENIKKHLGHGVVAEFDGCQIWVTDFHNVTRISKIALDHDVIARLNLFSESCMKKPYEDVVREVNLFFKMNKG